MTTERKRQVLGKGLGALIPGSEEAVEQGEMIIVPVEEVFPNPEQPRRTFDETSLAELAASIEEKGVLQPILVQRVPGGYELVAGERRLRASRLAGLKKVPVLLKKLDQGDKLELALVENIQREDLNPIEEAQAYRELQDHRGYTQDEIAKRVGKDRVTVANSLRLLALPEFVKENLVTGRISTGHARALLGLEEVKDVRGLLNRILKRGLSVRDTEEAVKRRRTQVPPPKTGQDTPPEILALMRRLERRLGSKVNIKTGKKGGRIEISYGSLEELNGVVEKMLKD
ncbi:ParB/RepB/Spo0J family partition protein [bacterium]|nr:MAG: ParB/RepB/Spo0J family partition protein [bacterium]